MKYFKRGNNTKFLYAAVEAQNPADVEITEQEYLALSDQNKQDNAAHMANNMAAARAALEAEANTARISLAAIGLTDTQVNLIFGLEPDYTP